PSLLPRSCRLRPRHRFKLRTFFAEPRAFRVFARGNEGPLRFSDGWRGLGALRNPGLRGIKLVATKEQRFRSFPRAPARSEFTRPGVLSDPVESDGQRLGQFRD